MNFQQSVSTCFKKYAVFSGRAARPEYWYWVLFLVLGRLATSILDVVLFQASGVHPLEAILSLITLLPTFAVAIRRLHDVDRSGWWLLMYLTIIGIIYPLLVWKCTKGTEGANRFGPDSIHPNARTVDVFT